MSFSDWPTGLQCPEFGGPNRPRAMKGGRKLSATRTGGQWRYSGRNTEPCRVGGAPEAFA